MAEKPGLRLVRLEEEMERADAAEQQRRRR
jgi:hypothetical protein